MTVLGQRAPQGARKESRALRPAGKTLKAGWFAVLMRTDMGFSYNLSHFV